MVFAHASPEGCNLKNKGGENVKEKVRLLPLIISILTLMALCFYSGCGDDGTSTFNPPTGATGATGVTGNTGLTALYDLRIDVTHGGQPVPGFSVTLSRLGTSEEGTLEGTDSSGEGWYLFENLSPGNYQGTILADDFERKIFTVTVPATNNQVSVTIGQWVNQYPGIPSGELKGVSFPDGNNGWAVGTYSDPNNGYLPVPLITHTSDGTNWTPQTPPSTTNACLLNGVSFPDATTGWAVGGMIDPNNISNPLIIHTPDGTNWAFQTVSDVVDPNTAGTGERLNGIDFVSSTAGWAVGSYIDPNTSTSRPIILNTTDGTTWNIQTPPDPNDAYHLTDVDFINPGTGWAAGEDRILYTQDGGITWTTLYSMPGASLETIHFIDANRGWVASSSGVFYTSDGGNTWIEDAGASNFIMAYMFDIFFVDAHTGWVAGDLLLNKVAGADWAEQGNIQGGGFAYLNALDFVSPQNGWAVGVGNTYPVSPVIIHYSE